jgi:hypothetical protein
MRIIREQETQRTREREQHRKTKTKSKLIDQFTFCDLKERKNIKQTDHLLIYAGKIMRESKRRRERERESIVTQAKQ